MILYSICLNVVIIHKLYSGSTMITTRSTQPLLLLLLLNVWLGSAFKGWGMNKPHYLFHLGDRRPVSSNVGWGYWADDQPTRLRYLNTKDNLYAHMVVHDGETFFQEDIEDSKPGIKSQIRYQLNGNAHETQIQMENVEGNNVTWFMYFSVENNDYKLVDHEKHTSFIHISPHYADKVSRDRLSINVLSLLYPNQTLTLTQSKAHSSQSQVEREQEGAIRVFGVNANISETYTINHISDTFKRLVRVARGEEHIDEQEIEKSRGKKDKTEKEKIMEWEKRQVDFIREDNWEGKSFVILYAYGTLSRGQKTTLYLTNSTKGREGFDHELFQKRDKQVSSQYSKSIKEEEQGMAPFVKHVMSNLYGGMTFYYGRLYTQNSLTVHKQDYSFSFTPSRLIFPRSFLWDDGFHQSVVVHYNPGLVLDVLTNWMNKIDMFGWVGREQIRGGEISSMMPDSRFVFQDWFEMNPPTLMLPLLSLLEKAPRDILLQQKLDLFLNNYYRKLEMWYRYFKNTQSHQSLEYQDSLNSTDRFFRWHCKDECSKGNFMGSGLDDYPRRGEEAEIAKQHVDLLSWLYLFSSSLATIGEYLEKAADKAITILKELKNTTESERVRNKYSRRVKYYQKQSQGYIHQLYDSFLDPSDSLFKDVVVAKADVFIEKFVNKIGYINLFPFFTGMLAQGTTHGPEEFPQHEEKRVKSLRKCLSVMGDEKLLLSEDGLRSLSLSDPLYGTDENYWRGAVWLPINYMVLRACKRYYWNDSKVGKEVREFYEELRGRLIKSVHGTYKETGYLYENYYQGRGHRGFPFYGWTSTVVNMITQQY